jgi:hypothetical protein
MIYLVRPHLTSTGRPSAANLIIALYCQSTVDHNGLGRDCNDSPPAGPGTTDRIAQQAASTKISLAEPELALLSFPHPNGGRSSMVEPRIVVPDVAGSNPVGHPFV